MKHYKEQTVKTLDYIECDVCHEKSGSYQNWGKGFYYIDNGNVCNCASTEKSVGITYHEKWECSDIGEAADIDVDMCPKCFSKKLIPWLESQGVKIDAKERDLF